MQGKWYILGPKNAKVQKFVKICSLGFSETFCDDKHSKENNSGFFIFYLISNKGQTRAINFKRVKIRFVFLTETGLHCYFVLS